MAERYARLFALPENLYSVGSPVVIAAGALLKDNQTGNILAQLKLQNIDNQTIKAATVRIFPMETAGEAIDETVTYQYLDLCAERDAFFGQKVAIPLPNAATRSISVEATEVIFSDNTKWTAKEEKWSPLKKPTSIDYLRDSELVRQFHLDYGLNSNYLLSEERDLWICVCGAINHNTETCCHSCTQSLSQLKEFNLDDLRQRKEKRHIQEAEEKRRNIRTAKKSGIALAAAAIVCVAAYFAIGTIKKDNAYRAAISLMEQEKYEEAIEAFTALGDYKDSPDQIANSQKAIEDAKQYEEAVSLFRKKEYDQASSIFASLGDYRDAPSYVQKLSDRQALEYNDALYYLEQGEYTEAYSLFTELSGYEDSDEYLTHFHYVPVTGSIAYYALHSNSRSLDAKYTVEYTCNGQGQVVHEKQILDNDSPATGYASLIEHDYTYDEEGHLIKDVDHASYNESAGVYDTVTAYTYDAAGNEIECKSTYKGKEREPYYTCTLNDNGLLEEKTYLVGANAGKTYVFLYDNAKRVLGYEFNIGEYGTATRKYSYTYDANGNLTSKEMGNGIQKYFYDDNSRLISYQNVDEKSGLAGVEKTYSYGWVYFPKNG